MDLTLTDLKVDDYDAMALPGGQMNPDAVPVDDTALAIIKGLLADGRTVAAICQEPALRIEAGAVKGRNVTSKISIHNDMVNAEGGGSITRWLRIRGIITSRHPREPDAYIAKIVEPAEQGR